jgi:hypothetical protein
VNGHTLGERAGWVLAATLVAFGSSGSGADRAVDGLTPASSVITSVARPAVASAATRIHGHGVALLADTIDWPAGALPAPMVSAPPPTPPLPAWVRAYNGTNHVWMPTLGVANKVFAFPCSRGREPDNLVYRWGCAGTNNVYLLGHAYGVFQALHDAYDVGRLKLGMPVVYADSHGRLHLYRVTTWRIVHPTEVGWAIAAQPVPSMTLQTCVGSKGTLRLNVRLVESTA